MNTIDMVGREFSGLTVIDRNYSKRGRTIWNCLCSCGRMTAVEGYFLREGRTKSCGCLANQMQAEAKLVDVSGQKFGRLTALSRTEQVTGKKSLWLCICECGNESHVRIDKLRSSHTTSCGCARKDQPKLSSKNKRLENIASTSKRRARVRGAGGSFTADQISELHLKQRGMCANCGVNLGDKFHRDHKVALSDGGTNDILNMELLCQPCNLRKHNKDPIDWANQNGRLC